MRFLGYESLSSWKEEIWWGYFRKMNSGIQNFLCDTGKSNFFQVHSGVTLGNYVSLTVSPRFSGRMRGRGRKSLPIGPYLPQSVLQRGSPICSVFKLTHPVPDDATVSPSTSLNRQSFQFQPLQYQQFLQIFSLL